MDEVEETAKGWQVPRDQQEQDAIIVQMAGGTREERQRPEPSGDRATRVVGAKRWKGAGTVRDITPQQGEGRGEMA